MKTDETPHRILVLFDADREQFFFDGHYLLFLIGHIRFFSPFLFTMSHIIRFDLFCLIFLSPFFFHGRTMETLLIFLSRRDFFSFLRRRKPFSHSFLELTRKFVLHFFSILVFSFFWQGRRNFSLNRTGIFFRAIFFYGRRKPFFALIFLIG